MYDPDLAKRFFDPLFAILEKAPKYGFVTDYQEVLTLEDVKLRKTIKIPDTSLMSDKEIVFRKFYEMRNLTLEEKYNKNLENMLFFEQVGLSVEEVSAIVEEIVEDIKQYHNSNGRIVINPF